MMLRLYSFGSGRANGMIERTSKVIDILLHVRHSRLDWF